MKQTGKILVLAFPDTYVTMSTEWICKILPLVGLGTKDYIKAGHAALVLIENSTGHAQYYDFGRYVTPKGHGRVRGANTDAELQLPITAKISEDNKLENLEELLVWLDANPQKTHGEGRLLASVCDAIDYDKAAAYITALQSRGSIPYGAFEKNGSNCARFVTDTILAATKDQKIRNALRFNKKFTPSTVGNVEKAATRREVFEVYDGNVLPFKGSALKENLTNYFDKNKKNTPVKSTDIFKNRPALQKLEGTGSSAWFEMRETSELPLYHYNIRRFNDKGHMDFNGVYVSEEFNAALPYQFTYDSHCAFCHVVQQGTKVKLTGKGTLKDFSSSRKQRSA